MALKSMTGYGRAEFSDAQRTVSVELKSVNNRFLDFQCRTPREQLFLEPLLRSELGKFISRGSVTCQVQYETYGNHGGQYTLNEPMFKTYVELIQRTARELGPLAKANVVDILKLPEMVGQGLKSESPEAVIEVVLPVFRRASQALAEMRAREGSALSDDLEARIQGFYPALVKVRELLPKRQVEYAAKMRERLQEILGQHPIAEDRLLTEIGVMAEKLDVTEEMVRLKAHLDHFLETVRDHTAPGKKLGFLHQEMLREVNTLGNKNQYFEIQQICVSWKEELEIVREQLMNVE